MILINIFNTIFNSFFIICLIIIKYIFPIVDKKKILMFKCQKCGSELPNSRKKVHEMQECKGIINNNSSIINSGNKEDELFAKKLGGELNRSKSPLGDSDYALELQKQLDNSQSNENNSLNNINDNGRKFSIGSFNLLSSDIVKSYIEGNNNANNGNNDINNSQYAVSIYNSINSVNQFSNESNSNNNEFSLGNSQYAESLSGSINSVIPMSFENNNNNGSFVPQPFARPQLRNQRNNNNINVRNPSILNSSNENEYLLFEFPLQNVDKLDDDKKKCIICLDDFKNGDKVSSLPCTHFFHFKCIKLWFKNKNICPLCKKEITQSLVFGKNDDN